MEIKIIAVGKIKNKNLHSLFEDYFMMSSPYIKVKLEEIEQVPFLRESDKDKSKSSEAEKIIKRLAKEKNEIILVDERGDEFDSFEFANKVKTNNGLTFVIGGTLGFSKQILSLSHKKMALSKFTLTHEMARVILMEQIYRATTIIKEKKYHY